MCGRQRAKLHREWHGSAHRAAFFSGAGRGQRVGAGRSEGEAWYPAVVLDAEGEQAGAFVWSGETLARAPSP